MKKVVKMKQHILTSGDGDDYGVLALLEGPEDLDPLQIYKDFYEKYLPGYRSSDPEIWANARINPEPYRAFIKNNREMKIKAIQTLHEEGYKGRKLSLLFLDWILKNYPFVELDNGSIYIDD